MKETNASLFLFSFFLFVFVGCGSSDSGGNRGSRDNIVGLDTLADLSGFNRVAYPVSGICDSTLGAVTVTMGEVDASPVVSQDLTCLENLFSGTIDAEIINFDPIVVTASQGSNSDTVNIGNSITTQLLLVRPLEAFTNTNKLSYVVRGTCESSIGENFHTEGGRGVPATVNLF